jgi:hypothetical protein
MLERESGLVGGLPKSCRFESGRGAIFILESVGVRAAASKC